MNFKEFLNEEKLDFSTINTELLNVLKDQFNIQGKRAKLTNNELKMLTSIVKELKSRKD